jgi:hypothetical protein
VVEEKRKKWQQPEKKEGFDQIEIKTWKEEPSLHHPDANAFG